MAYYIGMNRKARLAYGFDEVALVPGQRTVNPDEVDITFQLEKNNFQIPIIASAMDGVVDAKFAIELSGLGGLAILNLEGVQTRYENPNEILDDIAKSTPERATKLLQKLYEPSVQPKLIQKRIEEIKKAGGVAGVSATPQKAEEYYNYAIESGVDVFVVQSTVATVRHISTAYKTLDLAAFCKNAKVPIIVGNSVTFEMALELMAAGPSALLIGIGPGAACTTRGVLGIGVPQVTATVDSAAARDLFFKQSGRYVPIITDGGMTSGGDICKAFASGADAVMIGSAFAKAKEAPGRGFHWGMATPHSNLPRGTRIEVGITSSLEQILFGPATLDNGTQNIVGAIRTCMGSVGAKNIKEFQMTELIIAPAIKTEGKLAQRTQHIGMGKN
ncbi:MAG: GuaB3 family IMP dehydrogenase-related protein [Candidatus Hydrogenedentes bacterium CG07_land_8_20_14_0_80_42_17]|nr:MAG: inosine 5-monophosphate dehydrogenase [Candidatus Hydrogenedentes bacterium CG1_02_42_14]PIU47487.1 MAG: GuaB3 family IMP dehydrogenase-related protein [Candidatus Hydrogenedentes bacterium CG07_land_8_20_14_0_80_42_17]